MEINKEWERLNEKLFTNQSLKEDEIMNAITSESKSAIHNIKNLLKIKSYWTLGFIGLFTMLMIISIKTPQAMIAVGIINFIYIIGFFLIYFEANNINTDFSGSDNVLQSLQMNAKIIKRTFRFENFVFVFNSPLIILGSLFWARLITGSNFNALLQESRFITLAIVLCIIVVPYVCFTGKYLNEKAFGPHLNKLKDSINKLQGVELIKDMAK